ncbi:MAG TPA: hypothetical protein VF576_03195 [Rubricoccaceae bacterium]
MISPYIDERGPRYLLRIADACKEWPGTCDAKGYPRTKRSGRSVYAHRAAFEYFHRRLGPGERVYRACGNRRCVNVLHLVTTRPAPKGKRRRPASAKLNPRKVLAIRARWSGPGRPTQRELAEEYAVTRTAISHVVRRRTWADVHPVEAGTRNDGRGGSPVSSMARSR